MVGKRLRRRLGPVSISCEEASITLHFAFDQISSPGNKVEYEIEATAPGSSAHNIEPAVRRLFSHTGFSWDSVAVPHAPAPEITQSSAQG